MKTTETPIKKQLDLDLEKFKKQRKNTTTFIEKLQAEQIEAEKIDFKPRAKALKDLIAQENFYLDIINLKIKRINNQLKNY
jgi:hypothetical protein